MGWRIEDMPRQDGRTAIVTGANSGIGFVTARELARAGCTVVLACRDPAKADEAVGGIRRAVPEADVRATKLDLADLTSVAEFSKQAEAELTGGLDLLINNAGVMATPKRQTADGFELQLGTNHLGHFALTARLLPLLQARPESRVVTVSSLAHRIGKIDFEDLMMDRRYSRWGAYGQSKLANLLFAFELDRRMRDADASVKSMAAHPGYTVTHLQSSGPAMGGGMMARLNTAAARLGGLLIGQDAEMGALTTLRAATDPSLSGATYIGPGGPIELRGAPEVTTGRNLAYNREIARRLWEESERLTGVRLPVA